MFGNRTVEVPVRLKSAPFRLGTIGRYNLSDLSQLPIQDTHLYSCTVDGHRAATDPRQTILDCPYGPSTDTHIRCYRVAWRTAFRRARLRMGNTIGAEQIWRIAA